MLKPKLIRDASTYRAARRNFCLREKHSTWQEDMYYKEHSAQIKLRPYETRGPKVQFRLNPITHQMQRKVTHRKPPKTYKAGFESSKERHVRKHHQQGR